MGKGSRRRRRTESDQRRAYGCRKQERDDRQHLAGNAFIVRDKLGAGGDEAAGHLCDKQSEQAEKREDVDVAGDETQERGAKRGSGITRVKATCVIATSARRATFSAWF